MQEQPRLLSLFCGIGGFDVGFERAGFTTELAYDINKDAVYTFQHNHPRSLAVCADIRHLTAQEVVETWKRRTNLPISGVIGGPPCQTFSVNNRFAREDDPRNELPFVYIQLLQDINELLLDQPIPFVVFENVAGLVYKQKNKSRFEHILLLFRSIGYNISWKVVKAKDYKVPQERKRVFIVGLHQRYQTYFQFPAPINNRIVVGDVIDHLPEPTVYPEVSLFHPNHYRSRVIAQKQVEEIIARAKASRKSTSDVVAWHDRVAPAIISKPYIHYNAHRRLSVYEMMLLQTFPVNYVLFGTLTQQYQFVGNAVPPNLAFHIATAIREQLML